MTENKKICRICLSLISNELYTVPDETRLRMLNLISPSTDVQIDAKSILCAGCSEGFQKSFDFKTTCLNNEIYLKSYQYDDNVKLTLQEIVRKVNMTEPGIKTEYESVCRLCFEDFDTSLATDLGRIDDDFFLGDMIEKCLPEINLGNTQNPLMCPDCMLALQTQFNLISTLLDTNDKINDYMAHSNITISNNNCEVDLQNVLDFTESGKSRVGNGFLGVKVKEEQGDDNSGDVDQFEIQIKVEEDLVIKEEGRTLIDRSPNRRPVKKEQEENVDTTDQPIEQKPNGLYSCYHCQHETVCRASLVLHLLTHNRAAPVFRCDKCEFTSKWRTSLTQHSWLHEETQKMYRCEHCSYETRYKKHLKRHGKRHNPIPSESHRCQYCRFVTTNKDYFKLHNRKKHDVEVGFEKTKTFRCRLCDFTAAKKSFLTDHCKKSHGKKMYESLMCEECGFQAKNLWRLNDHKLKHKPEEEVVMLQCANCEFKTKYRNSLRAHLRRHNSGKNPGKKQES